MNTLTIVISSIVYVAILGTGVALGVGALKEAHKRTREYRKQYNRELK